MIQSIQFGNIASTQAPTRTPLQKSEVGGPSLPQDGLSSSFATQELSSAHFRAAVANSAPQLEATPEPTVPEEAVAMPLPTISDEERLLQPGTVIWELQPGWGHSKARTQVGKDYPERQLPSNGAQSWSQVDKNYTPTHYEAPILATQPGWADPPRVQDALAQREFKSYESQQFGPQGEPLNPKGPTGMSGRGLLGKHGANFAADPIVTRINPDNGKLEMIAIVREDLGQVAIPGGMVDHGEKISGTLARELCEETLGKAEHGDADAQQEKLQQMFERATPVYQGYVDDPRNTDNAWMETQAFHLHLTPEEAQELNLQKGSDAAAVEWKAITTESLDQMYASHGSFVKQAVISWQQESGLVVARDGRVGTR